MRGDVSSAAATAMPGYEAVHELGCIGHKRPVQFIDAVERVLCPSRKELERTRLLFHRTLRRQPRMPLQCRPERRGSACADSPRRRLPRRRNQRDSAGLPFPIEAWGVDAVVGRVREGTLRRRWVCARPPLRPSGRRAAPGDLRPLDLAAHLKSIEKNDTPWTPAVSLFPRAPRGAPHPEGGGARAPPRKDPPARRGVAAPRSTWCLVSSSSRTGRHASDTVTAVKNPTGMGDPEFRKVL